MAIDFKTMYYSFFVVVDGTSKEVSEKQDPWSSWALVVFLGITLTLVIIAIAIGKLHSIKKWDHFPHLK